MTTYFSEACSRRPQACDTGLRYLALLETRLWISLRRTWSFAGDPYRPKSVCRFAWSFVFIFDNLVVLLQCSLDSSIRILVATSDDYDTFKSSIASVWLRGVLSYRLSQRTNFELILDLLFHRCVLKSFLCRRAVLLSTA